MAKKPDVSYNSLINEGNPFTERDQHEPDPNFDDAFDADNEDTPRNSGIIIQVVPETDKARWNHIEDLDSFFTRMYNYHQKRGFAVILLEEIFGLIQFLYTVWLLLTFSLCINYPVLFGDVPPPNTTHPKVTIGDAILSPSECVATFGAAIYILLFILLLVFIHRTVKVLFHIGQYWDIKKFYNTALKMEDDDLDNVTWHEVQRKIREVQSEEQMCIQRQHLTELDIYHRILRFRNYMVALLNKNLLPVRFVYPILGECVYLPRGLVYAYEFILFRGPWSPWNHKGDVAVRGNRIELARRLRNQITWVAIIAAIFSPVIFIWMFANILFSNVAVLRKEPSMLGVRMWSNYGRLSLRHFNELDHELNARLNRGYDFADKYMSSFSSPIGIVLAKHGLFLCGGILAPILVFGIYEEHVFQVEHILTIFAISGAVALACAVLIPNENQLFIPEELLTNVLAHVHYMPSEWRGLAHTNKVRSEFGHFFQFKWTYILQEILSPICTPIILYFSFRPRSLEIVDFFRSFTVQVVGVGNVCSFALMDIRKHGNPDWQLTDILELGELQKRNLPKQMEQAENGKTELSLIHFTLTNPDWKMPPEAKQFMKEIKKHAVQDLIQTKAKTKTTGTNTAMTESLVSFGSLGGEYSSIAQSILQSQNLIPATTNLPTQPQVVPSPSTSHGYDFEQMLQQNQGNLRGGYLHDIKENDNEDEEPMMNSRAWDNAPISQSMTKSFRKMRVGKTEGRLEGPNDGLLYSLYGMNLFDKTPTDITTAEMCFSTIFLHAVHQKQVERKSSRLAQSQKSHWQQSHYHRQDEPSTSSGSKVISMAESTPLLSTKKS